MLTCSALKRSYRDTLRAAVPRLHFLHLALTPHQALERVAARTDHFYPPSLVASQFEALEDPAGEPRRARGRRHAARRPRSWTMRPAGWQGLAAFNNA